MKKFYIIVLYPLLLATAVVAAESQENAQPIVVDGTLVPVREVRVASRAKGVIHFIREEGERVHAGEAILALEDSMEKLEVNRQKKIM